MGQKKLHLQGLRTLAISAVLIFHFFPEFCPNGYLGVDQFFFLSGYLMSMMMHRNQSYSFTNTLDFLYKRVKRIAPLYYLATALILVSVYFGQTSAIGINISSAYPALAFATNLVRPDGMEGYAEKLGIAVDMFTHTWSLSLEMQFYLLFPIIFMLAHTREKKPRETVSLIFAATSYVFHLLSDSFVSFNCMLSRIWQFIPGMMVYDLSLENDNKEETDEIETKRLIVTAKGKKKNLNKFLCNITLLLSFWLLFYPQVISPLFARTTIIMLVAVIVHIGENNPFLEHKISVYLGEISYCWYLVHWPIVAHLKLNGFTSPNYMIAGLALSFLISVAVHHIFERRYINRGRETILAVVLVLLLVNAAILYQTSAKAPKDELKVVKNTVNVTLDKSLSNSSYFFEMDFSGNLIYGYENKTKEERAKLNEAFDAGDPRQLQNHVCKRLNASTSQEERCLISSQNAPTKPKLLVIGNSYAPNTITVINEECGSQFREVLMSTSPACEPLFSTITKNYNCSSYDWFFEKAVQQIRPDVLIIVNRHVQSFFIANGTGPFNDFHFKTAVSRLQQLEKLVKTKIYILDAFPEPTAHVSKLLNAYLRKGATFKDEQTYTVPINYAIARDRMTRLVQGCKKCELYDYSAAFFINGQYKVYDPTYYVAFFTKGIHLTPAGLERVRLVFRNICKRV